MKPGRFGFVRKWVSRRWFLAMSASLPIAIAVCLSVQPDALAAITLVPAWCWLVIGVLLVLLGTGRKDWRVGVGVIGLWLLFGAVFVEEPVCLMRGWFSPSAGDVPGRLRVVTLNCGEGQSRSVREVFAYKPDILLLQEAPARETVEELARELFGEDAAYIAGSDCAIITRGSIRPLHPEDARHFVHAEVELPGGQVYEVVSLRLAPPASTIDFWTADFWNSHAGVRRKHRQQLQAFLQSVGDSPRPLILGGDFNCPPLDAAILPLRSNMSDAFQDAGRGWGGTGPSRYPLFRVDQIYSTHPLMAIKAQTVAVENSDHHAVMCDFVGAPR